MRLDQLYYLVEIAKTGSISLTAERIYISQPTITEAIKKLEQELGATLLVRSHRGVSLTESGEKVVGTSRKVLELMDDLKSELDLINDKKPKQLTGNFTIYTSPDITYAILPNVLDIFNKRYPDVNICVKESDTFTLIEGIQDGIADLGIISMVETIAGNDVRKISSENIYFERLFFTQIYAVVGNSSPLASRREISIIELMKYPLAFCSTHTANCWIESLKAYGKPNIYIKSSSVEVFLNAICKDQAIGFMPDFGFDHIKDKKGCIPIPIKEGLSGVVGWLRPNNIEFLPPAEEFIKIFKSHF